MERVIFSHARTIEPPIAIDRDQRAEAGQRPAARIESSGRSTLGDSGRRISDRRRDAFRQGSDRNSPRDFRWVMAGPLLKVGTRIPAIAIYQLILQSRQNLSLAPSEWNQQQEGPAQHVCPCQLLE